MTVEQRWYEMGIIEGVSFGHVQVVLLSVPLRLGFLLKKLTQGDLCEDTQELH